MSHKYFDYNQAAEEAGISADDLAYLRRRVETDYPSQMLREMHLHAWCKAIGRGELTVAEALTPSSGQPPPISEMRLGG